MCFSDFRRDDKCHLPVYQEVSYIWLHVGSTKRYTVLYKIERISHVTTKIWIPFWAYGTMKIVQIKRDHPKDLGVSNTRSERNKLIWANFFRIFTRWLFGYLTKLSWYVPGLEEILPWNQLIPHFSPFYVKNMIIFSGSCNISQTALYRSLYRIIVWLSQRQLMNKC